jgi:hypothetical protein
MYLRIFRGFQDSGQQKRSIRDVVLTGKKVRDVFLITESITHAAGSSGFKGSA